MSETEVGKRIAIAISKLGVKSWRNNIGAAWMGKTKHRQDGAVLIEHPRFVEFGVCNPGGSDRLGYKSVEITREMVGKRIAVFTAIENKIPKGRGPTENQKRFLAAADEAGAIAGFARTPEQAEEIVRNWKPK